MSNKQAASVPDAFERALDVILARVSVSAPRQRSLAVAYSGGLDSSALLHLVCRYATERGLVLFAFHVHHGISSHADDWLVHCERECASLGVRFDARRITLVEQDRHGIEQAARLRRYEALGELCRLHRVPLLLTAHHLDDQAETVLLQLLRGSGIAGLSGMESVNTAAGLLGDPELLLGRPLLDVSRCELEQFVADHDIAHVEDESNADTRYVRNALRHYVMPVLGQYFPGFQARFMRSARHAQSAQRLLNERAAQDFAVCREGDCIDIGKLKRLDSERIDNLLRYWFALRGLRMPSTSWLFEARAQLFEAKADAQLRVIHPDCEIRRHRDRIFLTLRRNDDALQVGPLSFRWNGEQTIDFLAYGGSLHFEPAQEGIDAAWLRGQDLLIRYRSGGETLKPAVNRPTKPLKHHYQALNIPAWERSRLPLVCTAGGQLLFAAGIGLNWRGLRGGSAHCVRLRWEAVSA
ncbi:MAG TPA: tRNA lysidine(34) synthetase TilS [Noviherbaspirillum sp.]